VSVTARFKVTRVSPYTYATEIEMTPDYAEGRNKEWADATPSGMIRMTVKNELAAEQFKENASVHVLFEFPDD